MNGLNKLDCYITLDRKGLTGTNTLAYRAYFEVMNEMKYCEYNTWPANIRLGWK